MTDAEIDAMEAGPQLDGIVADVIGEPRCESMSGDPFQPSIDWNDAMYAAERFGLFDNMRHRRNLWRSHDDSEPTLWHIMPFDGEPDRDIWAASAPTGPMAICRAILKLARKE